MKRALDGIKILDLGSYIAGPYCCMLLADHGAEVIRVEPPGGKMDRELGPFSSDGQSLTYGCIVHRNKKNVTLNLRSRKGAKLLDELLRHVDVVVHNYPLGTEESKLLQYDRLRELNRTLIVVAISGFGQNGPYAEKICFDAIAQAMSGSMSISGYPGSPPLRIGVPYIDFSTATQAACGVLLALFERKMSGSGQFVDIALFDVATSIIGTMGCHAEYAMSGEVRKPVGNCTFYAYTGSLQAKNGFVLISVIGNHLWRKTCRLLNREDLLKDSRFKDNLSRYRDYTAIDEVMVEWTRKRTVEECMDAFEKAGIPCSPVLDVPAAIQVPQIKARDMLVNLDYPGVGNVPVPGVTIKLSKTPGALAARASFLGEDNGAIYGGLLGYNDDELELLKRGNVI